MIFIFKLFQRFFSSSIELSTQDLHKVWYWSCMPNNYTWKSN